MSLSSALALLGAAAAAIAVLKLLTSRRGYVVLPGVKFSWGR